MNLLRPDFWYFGPGMLGLCRLKKEKKKKKKETNKKGCVSYKVGWDSVCLGRARIDLLCFGNTNLVYLVSPKIKKIKKKGEEGIRSGARVF